MAILPLLRHTPMVPDNVAKALKKKLQVKKMTF